MYETFYGLKEKPFQIVSNPAYLYHSTTHKNVLKYLEYGLLENVGFILLTGEIGAGKTTLVKHITAQYASKKDIALVNHTNGSTEELVVMILEAFNLNPNGSKSNNLKMLRGFLEEKYQLGQPVLLIIDEAQNLSGESLEEVRLFSNFQSDHHHLIQVMLVGQPELNRKLAHPRLNSFSQRIAVNCFLSALSHEETEAYISHRLKAVDGRPDIFSPSAREKVYLASGGVPRTINLLCDAALVYGFGYDMEIIDADVLDQVIKDKNGIGVVCQAAAPGPCANGWTYVGERSPGSQNDRSSDTDKLPALIEITEKMDKMVEHLSLLETRIESLEESTASALQDRINKERKRSDQLLALYSQLKLKYEELSNTVNSNKKRRPLF